ncbi:MAG: ABC-type cytochrome c bioproteinis transport system permease component C [bacterium]|nr:MAG: ABC-type cytochrome c bioproteinis transport system permease component C [bacterium]
MPIPRRDENPSHRPWPAIVQDGWKWLLFIGMILVLLATFLWLPVVQRPTWDAATNGWKPQPWPLFRIMIFHVPMSWVASLAFLVATAHSIHVLRTGSRLSDLKAAIACELGLFFGILATVTGSIWARYEWGSFWNWDPRETSILILILIYGAYFALRSAVASEETRARLSAVYAILAFLLVPFLVFLVPRMVESLHPAPIFDRQGKMQMDGGLLLVFGIDGRIRLT